MSRSKSTVHGILCVDKPVGPTSHDVVAQIRRQLGTRRVGHAGTLDPLASGLLVILVGEATKLGPFLTGQDKRYEATIQFGKSTTTLDAEGETTRAEPAPDWLRSELRAASSGVLGASAPRLQSALADELARTEQVPPAFSAIKVQGRRSHALARRGEAAPLAPRSVRVASLAVKHTDPHAVEPCLTVDLTVAKGYYVRALARDVSASLGVPGHLSALRRLASGSLSVAEALEPSKTRTEALMSLEQATAKVLPISALTERGSYRASVGQALTPDDFVTAPEGPGAAGWVDANGQLVAIGKPSDHGTFTVERGFVPRS